MANIERLLKNGFRKHSSGSLADAEKLYRRALGAQPNNPEVLLLLGSVLSQQNQHTEALPYFERLLLLDGINADAHNNLGLTLLGLKRWDEAAKHFRTALEIQPDVAPRIFNLGRCLLEQRQFPQALEMMERVLVKEPAHADAYFSKGYILGELRDYDAAIACYRAALQIQPNHAEVLLNLGICLMTQKHHAEAGLCLDKALALQPGHAEAHLNRSMLHLAQGHLKEGFTEYEWRLQCPHVRKTASAQPRWDGGAFEGKTLLVYAEQGYGDTLQFARYLPIVKAKGGRVIFECQEELIETLQSCPGHDEIVARRETPPAHDLYISLVSLPHVLGTTLETIPAPESLRPSPEKAEIWKQRLETLTEENGGCKIGIVWAGSALHRNDHNRSCRLSDLAPLAKIPGAAFFSLQKGDAAQEIAQVPLPLIDLSAELRDFSDTAAVIDCLDLVISVDTSVAHLAGAMGKPVWTLLPFAPDWRWMLERDDTPWYPSMRLFRQEQPKEWKSVLEKVAVNLCNEIGVRAWETGDVQAALTAFLQALQRNPEDRDTVLNCADVFLAFGQNDDAGSVLAGYLLKNPADEEIAQRHALITLNKDMRLAA